MARIDKVVMAVRATAGTALSGLQAVKLDAGGSVVPSGTADAFGVTCPGGTIAAGAPVAILLRGEVIEFSGAAATDYYAVTGGGTIGTATGGTRIGKTVEASRLVVTM
jgi:hypothetical protein